MFTKTLPYHTSMFCHLAYASLQKFIEPIAKVHRKLLSVLIPKNKDSTAPNFWPTLYLRISIFKYIPLINFLIFTNSAVFSVELRSWREGELREVNDEEGVCSQMDLHVQCTMYMYYVYRLHVGPTGDTPASVHCLCGSGREWNSNPKHSSTPPGSICNGTLRSPYDLQGMTLEVISFLILYLNRIQYMKYLIFQYSLIQDRKIYK